MLKLPLKSMISVMIGGHWDPFTHGQLSYIKQALTLNGNLLICAVSSDKQLMMKKGKVNIPDTQRQDILHLILKGLEVNHIVPINIWDTDTTLVTEALRHWKPDIFFRGGDKTIEDMPPEERRVCEELGIEIRHAKLEYDVHGSSMLIR